MTEIVGFELSNSTGNIPPETWKGDGVLGAILDLCQPDEHQTVETNPLQEGEQNG